MWPEERREELVNLIRLVRLCDGLDTASHIIERLQTIIQIAKELNGHDLGFPGSSFVRFLEREALGSEPESPF